MNTMNTATQISVIRIRLPIVIFISFMRLPTTLRARFRFLVALPPVRDLLLCAKHLSVAANEEEEDWGR
jgi:hypothetical protein